MTGVTILSTFYVVKTGVKIFMFIVLMIVIIGLLHVNSIAKGYNGVRDLFVMISGLFFIVLIIFFAICITEKNLNSQAEDKEVVERHYYALINEEINLSDLYDKYKIENVISEDGGKLYVELSDNCKEAK